MVHIIPPDASALFDTTVFNAQVPKEGPKALPIVCPFTDAITSIQVNMLLTTTLQYMSLIQSAMIDNTKNSAPLTLNFSVLNWTVTIPPNSYAQVSLPVPRNCVITIATEGGVTVPICFMNVPIPAGIWSIGDTVTGGQAIAVAASTTQILGAAGGAIGDELNFVTVIPATKSPGGITIEDGGAGPVTVFTGGATSVSSLVPFAIPIQALSRDGAWTITTGADVSVLVNGQFT